MSTASPAPSRAAYYFLDEGGNLDFSTKGTRYFTISCVRCFRPFRLEAELAALKFDLIEAGVDIERFHATEDKQATRNRVFALIASELASFRTDSIIVEKRKTGPALRADARFYPQMLGYLLRYAVNHTNLSFLSQFVVITDTIPISRKRKAIEHAVKSVLKSMLPESLPYQVLHHSSQSCIGLQIADYFNWAIFRKWEGNDNRSLSVVQSAVRSQFDIFRNGSTLYY